MRLSSIINIIPDKELVNFKDLQINGVKNDSRKIKKGDIFICLKGKNHDGHRFINKAIENGAVAIISEEAKDLYTKEPVSLIIVPSTKKAYSLIAQKFYSNPAESLKLVGITGTTGKTSVAYLTYKVINLIGKKASLIGTAGCYSLNNKLDIMLSGPVTTPEPMELNYLFNKFKKDGSKYVILEASSFGLAEERLFGLSFDVTSLTNISFNHHINYHGSFNDYIESKTKLFAQTKKDGFSILNRDSEYFEKFSTIHPKYISYGSSINAEIKLEEFREVSNNEIFFKFSYDGKNYFIKSHIPGFYNAINILASFGICIALGFDAEELISAFSSIDKIPGRWDLIKSTHPATIVIDKANTPIAIQSISGQINSCKYKKKIVVFGNVGGGDKEERKLTAKFISNLFDNIILTTDDPEDEDPEIGFSDFLAGIEKEKQKNCIIEEDRGRAISKALSMAGKDDIVVILGRGNQREFLIKGRALDFDDTVETRKILISQGFSIED
jgi:UDP-N-acetylmuramoyl-L-alanyl-D-glutamate--2,6-diaminopimelate ligase